MLMYLDSREDCKVKLTTRPMESFHTVRHKKHNSSLEKLLTFVLISRKRPAHFYKPQKKSFVFSYVLFSITVGPFVKLCSVSYK